MSKIMSEVQVADLVNKIKAKADASAIPTTAAEVHALPDATKYGAALDFSINETTFVITAQLKDQDGNNLGAAKTVDLPLESVVVDGDYDATTKEVVLTLKNGTEVRFSVADLVSGLQTEITSSNKLSADLIEDGSTNKVVTATEKTTWNNKLDASALSGYQEKLVAGTGITIAADGKTISASQYTLPIASASVLGGIKVGSGLSIASDGTLTATGTSMVLYDTTGQNTDGAMTQKAVTDNLPVEFTTAEWNALWA